MPWPASGAEAGPRSALPWAGVLLAVLAAAPAPAWPAALPGRIVSTNLCTDQLLLLLADRARIASLSVLAGDPRSSLLAAQARGIPVNHGHAEQVVALRPDLVVTGTHATRDTVAVLRRLGIPVLEIAPAVSLAGVRDNLRELGAAIGEDARAARLIEDYDRRLAQLAPVDRPRRLFVDYNVNGWTSGPSSLVDAIADAAGFDTAGDRLGFAGMRQVSIEQLIVLQPDLIAPGERWEHPPALASQTLRHPALARLLARTATVRIADRRWACPLPAVLDVVADLAAASRTAPLTRRAARGDLSRRGRGDGLTASGGASPSPLAGGGPGLSGPGSR